MVDCELCQVREFPFLLNFCKSHPNQLLVVGTEHRLEFTKTEKDLIKEMFPGNLYDIRWTMEKIPDHCHCHVIRKRTLAEYQL